MESTGGGGGNAHHAPVISRMIASQSSPRARAADGDAFMPAEFQKTIPGNSQYDPDAPKQPFWPSFFFVRGRTGKRVNCRCVAVE